MAVVIGFVMLCGVVWHHLMSWTSVVCWRLLTNVDAIWHKSIYNGTWHMYMWDFGECAFSSVGGMHVDAGVNMVLSGYGSACLVVSGVVGWFYLMDIVDACWSFLEWNADWLRAYLVFCGFAYGNGCFWDIVIAFMMSCCVVWHHQMWCTNVVCWRLLTLVHATWS